MNRGTLAKLSFMIIACLILNGAAAVGIAAAEEYTFGVHNTTGTHIKKILVSENNKDWGEFDIGAGIKAGETVTLVWDESTNSESCHQNIKAVFADGSETESTKFDFCEEDLVLEF